MAVVAHGVLMYRMAAAETIFAEEDTTDQKPTVKETKDVNSEQAGFATGQGRQALQKVAYRVMLHKTMCFSKGFYDTPYNPPDQAWS
jgi:hypothetical protein